MRSSPVYIGKPRRNLLKLLGVAGIATVPGIAYSTSLVPVNTLLLLGPRLVFSHCQITRAEEIGGQTEVDFNFLVRSNDASLSVDSLETLELDFIFQPGNQTFSDDRYTEVDADGNGTYETGNIFNSPINVGEKDTIRVRIRTQQGIPENEVTPCVSPAREID